MVDAVRGPREQAIAFCESCLDKYGDTAPGVGWFRDDADTRYRVMLEVIRQRGKPTTILDLGCGASHLYEHIRREGLDAITYSGLDLSPRFLQLSRSKFPHLKYYDIDVMDPNAPALPTFDYVILNGLFTYKGSASEAEMFEYMTALVERAFHLASVGIAFNAMSKQVEWERDDLFHVAVDPVLGFLSRKVSRHIVVRHDYGLYEYTVYVYKTPSDPARAEAKLLL